MTPTTSFGFPITREETLADRQRFLTEGLTPVACASCGTRVLVRKNSPQHTSIQWTTDPARSCAVYAERGGLTATMDTCERLSASIADAAKKGQIPQQPEEPQ